MKTYFDCIPCLLRQALQSVRFVTDDESVHEAALRETLEAMADMDLRGSPPEMSQVIHRVIRDLTGCDDPYREVKDRFNRLALRLFEDHKELIARSGNRLETAVRLAIAGNVIDFGAHGDLDDSDVRQAVVHALSAPLDGDFGRFAAAVAGAERILYLTDNAGEIVFDRLLIEELPLDKVTVAVRGGPVINDATLADAEAAGLTRLVEVIDSGSDAPGTLLDDCSGEFRERFGAADLVIAKGQAHYETLSGHDGSIFFLLKAKCPVIARELGCPKGGLVLAHCRESRGAVPAG
jgi:uncharacterized protein with ATP-grasp and redox domains